MTGSFTANLRNPIVAIAVACEIGAVDRARAAAVFGRSRRIVSLGDTALIAQLAALDGLADHVEQRDPRSGLDLRGMVYACTAARLADLTALGDQQADAERLATWRELVRTRAFSIAVRLALAGVDLETAQAAFGTAVAAASQVVHAHPEDLARHRERLAELPLVPLTTALQADADEAALCAFLHALCSDGADDVASVVASHRVAVAAVPATDFAMLRRLLMDVADIDADRAVAVVARYRDAVRRIFAGAAPWDAQAEEAFGCVVVRAATVANATGERYPLAEAATALRAAAAAYGEGVDAARAMGYAARAHRRAGDLHAARADAEDAMRRWVALPPSAPDRHDNLATAKSDLAIVLQESGALEEALTLYEELYAGDSTQAAEHRRIIAARHIVALCVALGRIDEALEMAERVLILLRQVPQPDVAAATALNIARLALQWGRPALFDAAVQRVDAVLAGLGPRAQVDPEWLGTYSDVAHLRATVLLGYSSEADFEHSAEFLKVARNTAERAGDRARYVKAVLETAWCAVLLHRPEQALVWLDHLERGEVRFEARPYVLVRRAEAVGAMGGDPEPYLVEAIRIFAEQGAAREEATTWRDLGRMFAGRGDHDEAMAAFERAEGILRSLRDGLVTDGGRIGLQGVFEGGYNDVLRYLAERPGAALETWKWVQRAKSRTLVELVGLDPRPGEDGAPRDDGSGALLAEEAQLLDALRAMRVANPAWLDTTRPSEAPSRAVRDAGAAGRRLRTIWRQLSATMPEHTAVRLADEISSAEVVAALARPDD